jgi:deoxyribonuclease V
MRKLHEWNLSYSQAGQLQMQLAARVRFVHLRRQPRLVAGLDCAFSMDGKRIFAVAVAVNLPGLDVVETATAGQQVTFPYIPGLLSFREAPVCIAAAEKLHKQPDLFIVDGQGVAHPRRFGLASHLGLFFDRPTIGCAKSRLIGYFEEPPPQKGAFALLKDKTIANHEGRATSDEVIGAVVRTRTNVKPVFVSVGHKCLLEDAIRMTLACTTKYRLPEPTRLAHHLVGQIR